jgi:hypothetical protein
MSHTPFSGKMSLPAVLKVGLAPISRRGTVAASPADHNRDSDIVQRALAILEEESRSWTMRRNRAAQAQDSSNTNYSKPNKPGDDVK